MGMFAAVGSVYANMFNFSGRARRAEFWWFYLFCIIVSAIGTAGLMYWFSSNPQYMVAFRSEAAMQTVVQTVSGRSCCAGPRTSSSEPSSSTGSRFWP
jgi:uncharacterized membrane protein YhaH (DUF805 family)